MWKRPWVTVGFAAASLPVRAAGKPRTGQDDALVDAGGPILIFGAGGPLTTDLEDSCARLARHVAAGRGVEPPGARFLDRPGPADPRGGPRTGASAPPLPPSALHPRKPQGLAATAIVAVGDFVNAGCVIGALARLGRLPAPSPPGTPPASCARLAAWHEASSMGSPSKLSLFRPDALTGTRFAVGRHSAPPRGLLVLHAPDELLLLHYKYLGLGLHLRAARTARHRPGRDGPAKRLGGQYLTGESGAEAELRRFRSAAVDISAQTHLPWRDHRGERWWGALPRLDQPSGTSSTMPS